MNTYIWKTKEPIDTKNNKRMIGLYAGRTKHTAAHRTRGCAFSGTNGADLLVEMKSMLYTKKPYRVTIALLMAHIHVAGSNR